MSKHAETKITLDVKNLLCPMPVIRLQNLIKTLASGETLLVLCTDPGTKQDIPTWCRLYGHRVIDIQESNHEIHFVIEIIK